MTMFFSQAILYGIDCLEENLEAKKTYISLIMILVAAYKIFREIRTMRNPNLSKTTPKPNNSKQA